MKCPSQVERVVGIVAGTVCALMGALTWSSIAEQQVVWPFPALYFTELIMIGLMEVFAFLHSSRQLASLSWVAGGLTLAFSYLGALTVGLLFLPMALGFLAAGILSDARDNGRMGKHAGLGILAGMAQAVLMLAMARWF